MKKIISSMFILMFFVVSSFSLDASESDTTHSLDMQPKFNGKATSTASPNLCSRTVTFAQNYAQGMTTSTVKGSKSKGVTDTWFQLHTTSGSVQSFVGPSASVDRYYASANSGYIFGSKASITGTHKASGY